MGNANFAWVAHFIYHLSPMSDLVMALGEQMQEGQLLDDEIRRQLLKFGFSVGG